MNKAEYDRLTRAVSLVNSAVSRDTGEEIPHMMRMCAFVPINIPILFGMLTMPASPANTIFWQWFNQSFNAGLNYGNRNASSTYTTKDLAIGYSAAVGASITMALTLSKALSGVSKGMTGAKLVLINSIIATMASGTAGFFNTYLMRRVEMNSGIEIYSDAALTQKLPAPSKECARLAIMETAYSRIFLSMGCLMTPAVIFFGIDRLGRTPTQPKFKIPYEIAVFIFALMVALPGSIALFPQTASIKREVLE